MLHLFFFTSTLKSDKCSCITIITKTEVRARQLARRKFKEYNYKGRPRRLAI